ncbi:hypothetical protein FB45DRAFT_988379 [Roridomyces roridus]|uniref:Uncharacterized protein n=1 Tax=Roridomyces roridus TaxID=1738132 RepID=A0AAD7C9B9_9AGAR|nr:hypothetical protein FB45DRAFT_988379 [Roridomyces roridus]
MQRSHDELTALLARPKEVFATSAYWYRFRGVYFCLMHPFMWPLVKTRFLPCLILTMVVLPLPQVAWLAIFQGHLAWFNAVFLVLGEGAVVIALLFEAFFVDETLVKIFDAVLIHEGFATLVAHRRIIIPTADDPAKQLGAPIKSAIYSPFSFRLTIEFILFLPLTFIPIAGGPLYCLALGRRAGPFHHYRYFKLRGMNSRQQAAFVSKRVWKYPWFEMVTLLLQLIPVLSMVFLLTTAAGAALWAVDLERKRERGSDREATTGTAARVEV